MTWYDQGKLMVLSPTTGTILETPFDLENDIIVIGLLVGSPAQTATDDFYDDVTASGLAATNYLEPGDASNGTAVLLSKVVAISSNVAEFDAADTVLTNLGNGTNGTFTDLVVCREIDGAQSEANTALLAFVDIPNTLTNGGNVTLVWNSTGILRLT